MTDERPASQPVPRGTAREVLGAFLRLGCLSFGGPIAHLGYFHAEFVERRKWCDEETFAEIVAIAQSMPGPASSQVGFALGLLRAGWMGGAAAWLGFTMPSALLMLGFAFGHCFSPAKSGLGVVHGLQLVAVAVVAQAILAMRKSLAPDAPRMALALVAAAIAFCSSRRGHRARDRRRCAAGLACCRGLPQRHRCTPLGSDSRSGRACSPLPYSLPCCLFCPCRRSVHPVWSHCCRSAPSIAPAHWSLAAATWFFRCWKTPWLPAAGSISRAFLSGYGAAQALPGPLFTFAAYLGAAIGSAADPIALAALALVAIFLPGLLLIVAVLPFWSSLRQRPMVQRCLRGVNAAVVGVLVAAFIRPVWSSAVHSRFDLVLVAGRLCAAGALEVSSLDHRRCAVPACAASRPLMSNLAALEA